MHTLICLCIFFFFQAEDGIRDVAVTGVQTCALPISAITKPLHRKAFSGSLAHDRSKRERVSRAAVLVRARGRIRGDRKSTRLNSSHGYISYAVFCLKKKKKKKKKNTYKKI